MKLKLLFLALFGRLSTNELEQVTSMARSGSFVMRKALEFYLHHYADYLASESVKMLVKNENAHAWKLLIDSLAGFSKNRDVAERIADLPLRVFRKLSKPLSNDCVKLLFEQNMWEKLSWYVRDFPLSVSNEIRMVSAVKDSWNFYQPVLNSYLQHNKSNYVFYYPEAQHALVSLGFAYYKVLIDRFDVYYEPTELILEDVLNTRDIYLIRRLLFRTVVNSPVIRAKILLLYPELKMALDISELRRRFRSDTMMAAQYGVCNVFNDEQKEMGDLLAVRNYKNQFLINCIMAENRFHSLSFLAWFLYRYPELQKQVPLRFYERFL